MILNTNSSQIQECLQSLAMAGDDTAELIDRHRESLSQVFAYSDFVQKVAVQYPQEFCQTVSSTFENKSININAYKAELSALVCAIDIDELKLAQVEHALASVLRRYRHLKMAQIAILDLLQLQSIEESMLAVSALADCLLQQAYSVLHAACCKRYGTPQDEQNMLIIGMGKLGGKELNFSSDIDLIFTYPTSGNTVGNKPIEHQVFFTRLAQRLIAALDQVTEDGRVFRVDMRLRPLGESGPLVLPFAAFETYYLEQGRAWERYAMQKARIINESGDKAELQRIIQPFVYRKYIDYTTIDSIRDMKQLIETELRRRQISNNIKLGKGGIREVEFFIQSIQLIHAGRHQNCQQVSILLAMDEIENSKLQGTVNIQSLRENYLYLRKIEHYLQQFNDEQTQVLPELQLNQSRLCSLLDLTSFEELLTKVNIVMRDIHRVFDEIIKDDNTAQHSHSAHEKSTYTLPASTDIMDLWQLSATLEEIESLFSEHQIPLEAEHFQSLLSNFKKRVARAGVSARASTSANKLMPLMIGDVLSNTTSLHPDETTNGVNGIFDILHTICGRVTYLDLLFERPLVRQQLVKLCRKSPWVAEQISLYPILLDELLHPVYLRQDDIDLNDWQRHLEDQLRQLMLRVDTEDEEQLLERLREFKHSNQLRIAASDISGTLPINKVSDRLTGLAQVLLSQVVSIAWQQTSKLYGNPIDANPTDDLLIIAYGKFGGIELSYDSDLDVVFLFDRILADSTDESGSRKVISNSEFYIKLVQKICHICSTKTYNGILYEIDLRLRPAGNSGMLVSQIDTFAEYQHQQAWTWEHQALVRARAVHGSTQLREKFRRARHNILVIKREQATLHQQVVEMREKMRSHLLKQAEDMIDLKQCKGGVVDLEFVVQYLVLLHAHDIQQLTEHSDNLRLLETLADHKLLPINKADDLCCAYLDLRHATHRVQLSNKKYARAKNQQDEAIHKALEIIAHVFELTLG